MAKYLDQTGLTYFWGKIKGFVNSHEHPVGSVYITISSSFNPANQWGGTWSKIAEGQCLIQAGKTYTLGGSYGSNSHAITEPEMPSHTHQLASTLWAQKSGFGSIEARSSTGANAANIIDRTTTSAGSGQAMSLMQASLAVNIWKRTA